MAEGKSNAQRPLRMRRTRRVLAVFGLLLVVFGIAWSTGWPQRQAVRVGARILLGTEVELHGITVVGSVRVDEISVYDDRAARRQGRPLFVGRGVSVDYALRPGNGRYLKSVTIDRLDAQIDARDPDDRNYDFLLDLLAPTDEPADTTAITPERVEIASFGVTAKLPTGEFVGDGFRFEADLANPDALTANLRSQVFDGWWIVDGLDEEQPISAGYVEITSAVTPAGAESTIVLGVPGLIEGQGQAGYVRADDGTAETYARFDVLRVFGGDIQALFDGYTPEPVRFAVADLSGTDLSLPLTANAHQLPVGRVMAFVDALRVGDAEAPLFEGAARIVARTEVGETRTTNATVTFNESLSMETRLDHKESGFAFEGQFNKWSRDGLAALLPPDARFFVEGLAVDRVSATWTGSWDGAAYTVRGDVSTTTPNNAVAALSATYDITGAVEGETLVSGTVKATLAGGTVDSAMTIPREGAMTVASTLAGVDPAPWIVFLGSSTYSTDLALSLDGPVNVTRSADGLTTIAPNVAITRFASGDLELTGFGLEGSMRLAADGRTIESAQFTLKDGGDTSIVLSGTGEIADPMKFAGDMKGKVILTDYATALGADDLWGEFEFTSQIDLLGADFDVPFTVTSPFLGYGDHATPEGRTLEGAGTIVYNAEGAQGSVDDVAATLGEGVRLSSERIDFGFNPLSVRGPLALASSLAPVHEMGFASAIEGNVEGSGSLSYSDAGLDLEWALNANAPSVTLTDDVAALTGLALEAKGRYRDGLTGSGTVRGETLLAAGANITGLSGPITFEDDRLVLPELAAAVFNGTFGGRAEVGLFEEGLPIRLTGTLTAFDLARLTEEVQPPKVRLTGTATGSADLTYAAESLTKFNVEATSSEKFSINRDAVREILESEQFRATLGIKQIEKVMDKILGTAPQRPFDSASLRLWLEPRPERVDEIRGTATLKSEKTRDYNGLDLDVEISMDPSALAEGLKLIEDSEGTSVDF